MEGESRAVWRDSHYAAMPLSAMSIAVAQILEAEVCELGPTDYLPRGAFRIRQVIVRHGRQADKATRRVRRDGEGGWGCQLTLGSRSIRGFEDVNRVRQDKPATGSGLRFRENTLPHIASSVRSRNKGGGAGSRDSDARDDFHGRIDGGGCEVWQWTWRVAERVNSPVSNQSVDRMLRTKTLTHVQK